MNKKISIIIPVYNSSKNLEILINSLILNLKKNFENYEIILVDDLSTDGSWSIVEKFCADNDYIKGSQLRKNVGQHNAIFSALKYCNGEVIITMDDDGQNSADDIIKLVDELNNGYDICYANYKNKKHNLFRKFGSQINNIVASALFNKPINLTLTSFRCFKKEIKDEILKYTSPSIYLDGIIFSITKNASKIFVEHKKREFGKSNYTFFKLFSLWIKMATSFSILPLRIASVLGILFSFSSFIFTLWLVFFRSVTSDIPVGWTSLIVVITFFGGIQLLALGLIGEYLGRTYMSSNNSLQFSEKNKLNIK